MDPNLDKLPATADQLHTLAAEGHFFQATLERALHLAGHLPDVTNWRRFLDMALLILGAAFVISGIFFFFAYNWADLSSFFKFGLIEVGILAAAALTVYLGLAGLPGKVALTGAALLVGVLLGVFGQVYQTGADAYQLFLTWSILIGGWVLISRYSGLWFGLLVLLNITLLTYSIQGLGVDGTKIFIPSALLNGTALIAWEYAHHRHVTWLHHRWLPWLLVPATYVCLLIPTLEFIFADLALTDFLTAAPFLYLIFAGSCLYFYQKIVPDLFSLTITALSLMVVITALFIQIFDIDFDNALVLLIISLFIIGQTAVAVTWLRGLAAAWEGQDV